MLFHKYLIDGVAFSVKRNQSFVSFSEWSKTDDCIYYLPLSILVDNGNASVNQYECFVPYMSLYLLDSNERDILGLPVECPLSIRVSSKGMLNRSDFEYVVDFLSSFPDGDVFSVERTGPIINTSNGQYLLNESQYLLLESISSLSEFSQNEKTPQMNMIVFSKIKKMAKTAGAYFDSYLENEDVYVPDKIGIHIERNQNEFSILPCVSIDEGDKFTDIYRRSRKVPGVVPIQRNDGSRVRVVLNDNQLSDLSQLKDKAGISCSRETASEIIQNPTKYFDMDSFDLSELYSDRVIEIGVYNPKFFPFISPFKSDWVAGATVETPEDGTSKIYIKDKKELESLSKAISVAKTTGSSVVEYKDTILGVEDAEFLADLATKQLHDISKPLSVDRSSNREVLIIKDNTEDLCFEEADNLLSGSSKFKFYKDSFFKQSFILKEHQMEGIAWLQYLFLNGGKGCLLADDMGLGKTLQILYFLDWHSRQNPNHKPYLIVAPLSLLVNWGNEYERFFIHPHLKVLTLTSGMLSRAYNSSKVSFLQEQDIILTNYETLRMCQLNLCAVNYDIVVLDEAQKIKTPGTLVTNAAKALKSSFRIAMTGTPVENTLLDLWCITDFCLPGLLGNAKCFAHQYQSPLANSNVDLCSMGNELHEKLGIHFMRRLKQDVAQDLPQKFVQKRPVNMPLIQENYCSKVISDFKQGLSQGILPTIMSLREISDHPFLYDKTLPNHQPSELIETSAKLPATIQILDEIKDKHEKVLIFAERKDIQKMLQTICFSRYGIIPKIINGETPAYLKTANANHLTRQASIDEFQSRDGFNILILSPIAVGMGLNVVGANHVIHFSRHWNPAKEDQATDRAYRIGQTKDVFVYYPIAVSPNHKSFDQTIDELLSRKSELAKSTIFPTNKIEINQDDFLDFLND